MHQAQKIRVLMVVNRLALGGPLIHACMLTQELSSHCEIILAGGPPLKSENLPLELFREYGIKPMLLKHLRRSINPVQDILALVQLYLVIRKYKPQIVHSHSSKPGFAARLAARLSGTQIIIHTFHGNVFSGYFNCLLSRLFIYTERALARISTKIICISPSQKIEICETYAIAPSEKVETIPLGIKQNAITDPTQLRQHTRTSSQSIIIGFVGRLEPIKNPLMFAHAFADARKHSSRPVAAVIIGDGSLRSAMENVFESYQIPVYNHLPQALSEGVAFLSWKYPPDQFYKLMDIYALTSINEGTPLSIMEAMRFSVSILATNAGGVSDLVEHQHEGLLSDVNDLGSFSKNLQLLINDDALRKRLSEKALEKAQKSFDATHMSKQVLGLYQALL